MNTTKKRFYAGDVEFEGETAARIVCGLIAAVWIASAFAILYFWVWPLPQ